MNPAPAAERYLAIDVLRGLTVALMIVVNMSISESLSFAQLLHTTWNGFTLTDAVFPTFLFIVGASLGFTADRYARDGAGPYFRRVTERSARIFLCGLIVSNFPFFSIVDGHVLWQSFDSVRIMGVLQRIALAYLIAAGLLYGLRARGVLLWSAVALLGVTAILLGYGDFSLTGNAAVRVDRALLGASHLYQHEGAPFDPEGLLGTLPAAVNVLAGYLATAFLRARAAAGGVRGRDLAAMAGIGVLLIGAAMLVDPLLPINKKLWTASYTLCTIGLDLLVLAGLIQWIDRWRLRFGTRYFEIFGKNALAVYMAAELAMNLAWTLPVGHTSLFMAIYEALFAGVGGKWGSLVYALLFTQACWLLAWTLDRRKIHIRL